MSSTDNIGPSVEESPSSPTMDVMPQSSATAIPIYSVSDSDEDRTNALMRSFQSQAVGEAQNSVASCSNDPDIIVTDPDEVIDLSDEIIGEEAPAVQLTFMNTDIGRKYRHDIEEFFHTLMTTEALNKDKEPLPKIFKRPNLRTVDGEEMEGGVVPENTIIGTISVFRSYMVDKHGWPMISNMLEQTAGISIPVYEQPFAETYPPPEDAKILEDRPIKTSKKCFNCGGDGHEMRKCTKPFDRRTFAKNKAKFLATGLQYGRYHKEEKNKKMKPGELSDSLKKSLGLADDELPQHIYRMRQLGYPPGWLLHAEATNSGLAMFDKIGKEVDLDGDKMEDGQVPEHRIRDEQNLKYNSDDLISYPGFNSPCPEGINDKADLRRGYPAMQSEHNLDAMSSKINIVQDENKEQTQKRNRYDSTSDNPKRFKASNVDMDLSDGEDDAIIEIPSSLPAEEGSPSDDDIQEYQVIDELSPEPDEDVKMTNINETLTALEEHKQKLLAELDEMEGSMVSSTPAQPARESGTSYDANPPPLDIEEGEHDETPTPSYQSMSHLISTPIVHHSGIEKLPAYDKFSDGITEHLFFENLPNSTGVYEKMSGLLKNVKEKMATLRPKRKSKK